MKIVTLSVFISLLYLPLTAANFPQGNPPFIIAGQIDGSETFFDPGLYAGTVTVRPGEMRESADSLHLDMQILVGREAMKKRQSWTIIPELSTSGAEQGVVLPAVLINGKVKAQHYRRRLRFEDRELTGNPPYLRTDVRPGRDTVLNYSLRIPYQLWMDTATLKVRQILTSSAGYKQLFTNEQAGMVALEPRTPYQTDPWVNLVVPEKEVKQRKVQGQAYLDFQVGRSQIIPTFRRNPEELARIAEVITKVQSDPDIVITGLFIEGYASPEGSYALNERLSRERAHALKDYIRTTFSMPEELFRVSSIAEDWDGLRALISESNIPQKERIYAIIDSDVDYDVKEARLRVMGGPYRTMLSELFPRLRRVEYQIDFSVKDYSVEESRDLAGRNPELLSQRELFILAQSYPVGSADREETFDLIFRLYPDEVTAVVNSAAAMLQRGEDLTAKRYLDRAGDDPRAYNNLGVFYLQRGEMELAREYFEKAVAHGIQEAAHNLEELEKKLADNEVMKRYQRTTY